MCNILVQLFYIIFCFCFYFYFFSFGIEFEILPCHQRKELLTRVENLCFLGVKTD